jgi:nucleotide sugar dehydrogenase
MSYQLPKIGIIGLGFVGKAIYDSGDGFVEYVCIDSDPRKGYTGTYKEIMECEGIFICVPSPMLDDGRCDTSILDGVLSKLKGYQGIIISKVTAPPDVYQTLEFVYPNLVHSPEFLTAANALRDFNSSTWSIVGGSIRAYLFEAERILKIVQPSLKEVRFCKIGEAALAKYAINSFLATKVVFMNELYQLSKSAGLDYEKIASLIKQDARIGNSHMQVPGLDGNLGFGGYCFPKDTLALLKFAEAYSNNLSVLDTALKKNTMLRLTSPK